MQHEPSNKESAVEAAGRSVVAVEVLGPTRAGERGVERGGTGAALGGDARRSDDVWRPCPVQHAAALVEQMGLDGACRVARSNADFENGTYWSSVVAALHGIGANAEEGIN